MRTLVVALLLGVGIGYLLGWRRERATSLKRSSELDDLTRDELYKRAQAEDVPGRSSMSKEELHDALEENASDTAFRSV